MGREQVALASEPQALTGVARAGSDQPDPVKAAKEIYEALADCEPECVVFYCCVSYPLEVLSKELTQYFADITLIGCTSAGEITPLEKAVSDAPLQESSFALSLLDGLSVREELVINALSMSLQDIPLVGGSAGDDQHFVDTQVFYNGKFYGNAAVIMLVNTANPFEVFSYHHLAPDTEKLVVTQVAPDLRVVQEFNAEPAALEYCRINDLKLEDLNSETFAMYPLAVQVGDHLYIRSIQQVNDDLSLTFFCAIDSGVVLTKMSSPGLLSHTSMIFNLLTESVGDLQLLIGFDCIHRRIEINNHALVDDMSALYRKHNVIGFSTYGEQINGLHLNHTFTGVAIGYPRERKHAPYSIT